MQPTGNGLYDRVSKEAGCMTGNTQANLDAIVSRGDLRQRYKGKKTPGRFSPTPLDKEMLKVASAAVDTCMPTAMVLPLPSTRTSVILAATMLISCFVKSEKMVQHVALASRNIELREFYDSLYLSRDVQLAEYFLRTVVDSKGIAVESSNLPSELMKKRGRLHFVSKVEKLQKLSFARSPVGITPQGIVVESNACDKDSLKALLSTFAGKIPIIYLTVDPFDPFIQEFDRIGALWAWDNSSIASLSGDFNDGSAICIQSGALRKSVATDFEVIAPESSDALDGALKRLWEDLVDVNKNPLGPGFDATGWVWGVLSGVSQLAVPLRYYDLAARSAWGTAPLKEAPEKAQLFVRNAFGEAKEMWEILTGDLEDVIEAADKDNPKVSLLVRWVNRCLDGGINGMIVARNRASKKALEAFLDESTAIPHGWRSLIDLVPISNLGSGRRSLDAQEVLIPGPLQSRYGWLLAMPLTPKVNLLSHGSWETGRIARQIGSVNERLTSLSGTEMRLKANRALFGNNPTSDVKTTEKQFYPNIKYELADTGTMSKEAAKAIWSPFDVTVARSLDSDGGTTEHTLSNNETRVAEAAESLLVTFRDATGYFQPNCTVSKITGKDVREVAAKSLKPGDRVVLVERGARRDLFMLIVDKLESLPEMNVVVSLIREWHERARLATEKKALCAGTILEKMRDTEIKSPGTVNGWIKGSVHGPNKPENIRRFGIAVEDRFLTENWMVIGKALKTVRGHRIKLGRMLNAAINGLSAVDMEDSGYFDRRLGIHFSDLADAISVHTVVAVSTDLYVVPHTQINKLTTG